MNFSVIIFLIFRGEQKPKLNLRFHFFVGGGSLGIGAHNKYALRPNPMWVPVQRSSSCRNKEKISPQEWILVS